MQCNVRRLREGVGKVLRPGQVERCVFCDRPIGPDEPRVGRGEAAAHAACADAGLGDERRWDRIAAALGENGEASDAEAGSATAPAPDDGTGGVPTPGGGAARSGCATMVGLLLLCAAAGRVVR